MSFLGGDAKKKSKKKAVWVLSCVLRSTIIWIYMDIHIYGYIWTYMDMCVYKIIPIFGRTSGEIIPQGVLFKRRVYWPHQWVPAAQ